MLLWLKITIRGYCQPQSTNSLSKNTSPALLVGIWGFDHVLLNKGSPCKLLPLQSCHFLLKDGQFKVRVLVHVHPSCWVWYGHRCSCDPVNAVSTRPVPFWVRGRGVVRRPWQWHSRSARGVIMLGEMLSRQRGGKAISSLLIDGIITTTTPPPPWQPPLPSPQLSKLLRCSLGLQILHVLFEEEFFPFNIYIYIYHSSPVPK